MSCSFIGDIISFITGAVASRPRSINIVIEYKSHRSTLDLVEVEGVSDGNALQ